MWDKRRKKPGPWTTKPPSGVFKMSDTGLQDNCSVTKPWILSAMWSKSGVRLFDQIMPLDTWTLQEHPGAQQKSNFTSLRGFRLSSSESISNLVAAILFIPLITWNISALVLVEGGFIFPVTCTSKMHIHSSWVSAYYITQRTNDFICELLRGSANRNIIS